MGSVVVVEKRPRWAPELQRQLLGEEIPVFAARTFDDGAARVAAAPQSLLVVDLEAALEPCLQFLGRQIGRATAVRVIALSGDRTANLEWPLRELGALAVLPGMSSGDELAALCRRGIGAARNSPRCRTVPDPRLRAAP